LQPDIEAALSIADALKNLRREIRLLVDLMPSWVFAIWESDVIGCRVCEDATPFSNLKKFEDSSWNTYYGARPLHKKLEPPRQRN